MSDNQAGSTPNTAHDAEAKLSSLQKEGGTIAPSEKTKERAIVKDFDALHAQSIKDPVAFWEEQAKELNWVKTWDKGLEWDAETHTANWFAGGQTNITLNALDRHADGERRNKAAYIWSEKMAKRL